MKRLLFFSSVCLFSLAVMAENESPAQAAANPSLDIEALVTEALEKNPEVTFYKLEIRAARGARETAGRWANPELSGGLGRKQLTGAGLAREGKAWSVALAQPLEWPGRIGLRKAIANRELELAELGLERFRAVLAGRVRVLAYGLFAAQEKALAAREVAGRFQELREALVQRDPAGLTPLLETRIIEATELTMRRKEGNATLELESALLELNQLRGAAPEARLLIGGTHLSFRPAEDLESMLSRARTNNFELRLRATELEQQGLRVRLARNERYPTVTIGPMITDERAGDHERTIGVGISIPLPLWNRNSGNIDAATARKDQAEVSLAAAQREIERKVVEAALIYKARLAEIDRWRPDSAEHFREAAELADRHYRLGAVPVATYVELQKQYLEAVEGLLETRKEALEAAAQLEALTGLEFYTGRRPGLDREVMKPANP